MDDSDKEGNDDSVMDEAAQDDIGSAKAPSKYYKVPTNEEMRSLRETEELFQSNVFKLQIDELVKEVDVPPKRLHRLQNFLHRVKEIIDATAAVPTQSVAEARSYLEQRNISMPFDRLEPTSNLQLAYEAPLGVHVVGSFLIGSYARPTLNVDLAVEMAPTLFQPKDHMNYRYHHKRAFVLGVLATELAKHQETAQLTFETWHGDISKPILVISSPSDNESELCFSKSGFVVRLLPMLPAGVFSLDRLGPDRNSVRANFADNKKAIATPLYNHSVREDMSLRDHLALLHASAKTTPALKDAIRLAKVWLYQRNMTQAQGQVDGFLFSMIMLALMQDRRLNKHMSSYQLFKATLQSLGTMRFDSEALVFNGATDPGTLAKHHHASDAVLLDAATGTNLLTRVSVGALSELQHEARLGFEALNTLIGDPFTVLFLRKLNPLLQYDNVITVPHVSTDQSTGLPFVSAHPDFHDPYIRAQRNIPRILLRGLTTRVNVVRVYTSQLAPWHVHEQPPTRQGNESDTASSLTIGLILDPVESLRLVDLGPSPDDTEAVTRFQSLWGSKSELRRFKDGSIAEAVAFAVAPNERHLIVAKMISWLLHRHFAISFSPSSGLAATSGTLGPYAAYLVHQADNLLRIPPRLRYSPPTLKSNASNSAGAVLDQLSAHIKALNEFPLSIVALHGTSSGLRGTSVFQASALDFAAFPAKPRVSDSALSLPPYVPVHDVIVQVENTTAWPDEYPALLHALTAMYLRLGQLVRAAHPELLTTVTPGYLDVMCSGHIFRLRLKVDKRLTLLARQDDEQSRLEHAHLRRFFETNAQHAGGVRAFSQRHPSYAMATRIACRWIAAHLFIDDIPFEVIECLMAFVFAPPIAVYLAPASALTGFHRFLELLAHHDFNESPVIVDWTSDLLQENRTEYATTFNRVRGATTPSGLKGGPSVMIFSSYDSTGTVWTHEHPSHVILHRLSQFAAATLHQIEAHLNNLESLDYRALFIPVLDEYDVLVRLRTAANPRACESVTATEWLEAGAYSGAMYKNLRALRVTTMPLVDFDPAAALVRQLRAEFGHLALFFRDSYGGRDLAIKWRPSAFVPQTFKVANAYAMEPVAPLERKDAVVPNVLSILSSIRLIGGDMIESLEIV